MISAISPYSSSLQWARQFASGNRRDWSQIRSGRHAPPRPPRGKVSPSVPFRSTCKQEWRSFLEKNPEVQSRSSTRFNSEAYSRFGQSPQPYHFAANNLHSESITNPPPFERESRIQAEIRMAEPAVGKPGQSQPGALLERFRILEPPGLRRRNRAGPRLPGLYGQAGCHTVSSNPSI